jgi:FAD/FMN-containing dehydrogenase
MSLAEPGPDLLDRLRALLGPQGWRAGEDAGAWLDEPRGLWRGRAALVARPASTDQVSAVVRACAAARVAIVPRSGGTGLVGGQTAPDGPTPVVLALDRMAAIRSLDPAEGALVAEAGVTLAAVRAAAEAAGRLFPLSLASEGSARVGGLLAANAGGVAVLRYGNARDLTLGIEAVMPDGSVLRGPSTLRKDNAGYDLRHLLIGSEGTLGVITAAALRLFPRPREVATAFCAVADPAAAGALLDALRDRLGDAVTAFELMSAQGMAFLAAHVPEAPRPPVAGRWFALAEVSGAEGAQAGLEAALAEAFEAGLVSDAALAASGAQRAAFWRIRELTPEANRRVGALASHDLSLPLARIARFIAEGEAAVAAVGPGLRVNCFGHLGDGNLHYNVFPPEGVAKGAAAGLRGPVMRAVHDLVHAHGGSVAAEHGVGRLKTADLERYGDPAKLAAMRAIKAALDPAGIMNPGAVLRLRDDGKDGA